MGQSVDLKTEKKQREKRTHGHWPHPFRRSGGEVTGGQLFRRGGRGPSIRRKGGKRKTLGKTQTQRSRPNGKQATRPVMEKNGEKFERWGEKDGKKEGIKMGEVDNAFTPKEKRRKKKGPKRGTMTRGGRRRGNVARS